MSEILETIMLICFGLSWPLNLVKNIKCGSAKGMSLPFILLITFGYIAGISSKIMAGRFNYVFAVYILNIVIVALNIVVYFVNLARDRKKESCDKKIIQRTKLRHA